MCVSCRLACECTLLRCVCSTIFFFFFFNDTATTEIYTLSLHDALPILPAAASLASGALRDARRRDGDTGGRTDRKSTRLNSSHGYISYAVFCLKKKKSTQLCNHLQGEFRALPVVGANRNHLTLTPVAYS